MAHHGKLRYIEANHDKLKKIKVNWDESWQNRILQWKLGGQKLYWGKEETFWEKCGPISELLWTYESSLSSKFQKVFKKRVFMTLHILRQKCVCSLW